MSSISTNIVKTSKGNDNIIDLTSDDEDYEPSVKKGLNNNGHINFIQDEQAGSSHRHKSPVKSGSCVFCFINGPGVLFIDLKSCSHRFCYKCFIHSLQMNHSIAAICAHPTCQEIIGDGEIKEFLCPVDYICYLEHSRSVLRKAYLKLSTTEESQDDVILVEPKKKRRSELRNLQNLDLLSYIKNFDAFECPICFNPVEAGAGVMLKNCLHTFCLECLNETVKHSADPLVLCPHNSSDGSCSFFIQEREIRALVSTEVYESHLSKGLKRAETNLDNVFHCKTPDCIGWIQYEEDVTAFPCPVCEKINCIRCKTIHEEKTCEQYKFDIVNDEKNQRELKLTEEAVKTMLEKGEAMLCPKCEVLIQKDVGCDYVQCLSCKLGICYRTKKPRQPLKKLVNGQEMVIDGCHCREKGKKCHPLCANCH